MQTVPFTPSAGFSVPAISAPSVRRPKFRLLPPVKVSYSELITASVIYGVLGILRRRLTQLSRVDPRFHARPVASAVFLHEHAVRRCQEHSDALVACLVNKCICSPAFLRECRKSARLGGATYRELRENMGYLPHKPAPELTPMARALMGMLQVRRNQVRRSTAFHNLRDECALMHARGWFAVFNTLSVSDEHYDKVFSRGSRCFSRYISDFRRSVDRACGLKRTRNNEASAEGETHRYFAATERGANGTQRLHIHVIHFCKRLPEGCVDPNPPSMPRPVHRAIHEIKKFWKYGFSDPLQVRYSNDDAFSRAGWRWPDVVKDGVNHGAAPAGGVMALVNYVSGYVNKQQETTKCKTTDGTPLIVWRTKQTRNFGRQWFRQRLQTIPSGVLAMAARETKTRKLPPNPNLPSWIRLRKQIIRELARRRHLDSVIRTSVPAPPLLTRGSLNLDAIILMIRFPRASFGSSNQARVDAAISDVRGACFLSMPGVMFSAARAAYAR